MAEMLRQCANLSPQITPFELPTDLNDNFAAAAWKDPHQYLHEDYRMNISSFRLADAAEVNNGIKRSAADLQNGRWKSYMERYSRWTELTPDTIFSWRNRTCQPQSLKIDEEPSPIKGLTGIAQSRI
jgi:hypothetical protein